MNEPRVEAKCSVLEVGGLCVSIWLHTDVDPPARDWEPAIETIRAYRAAHRVPVERLRSFVVSDGGAPNAKQRAQLAKEIYENERSKASVITTVLSNPIKRGVATAIQWLNPDFRFFEPREVGKALAWVDLDRELDAIHTELVELQKRLPPVKALASLARAANLRAGA